jgi:hypothetical protein
MNFVYIVLFIFVVMLMIDRTKSKKGDKFDLNYYMKSFFKVFVLIALLFIGIPIFLYYQMVFNIEDEYEQYFETPIELISDLEGFGMGFLDGYAQFAFKAESGAALKDNDKYILVTDSVTKIKTINDFQKKFDNSRYEKYGNYLKGLTYDNTDLKFHYRDSSYVDKKYLYMKNENIHFITIMY